LTFTPTSLNFAIMSVVSL